MSVVVIATINPLPEYRDEVIAAFGEIIPLWHAEDGCELYALNQAEDRLVMIEKWAGRPCSPCSPRPGRHWRGRP